MAFNRKVTVNSIVDTVADYRLGEINPIDPDHVERWVSQFSKEDQPVILNEMDRILKDYYVSCDDLFQWVRDTLSDSKIFGNNLAASIVKTHFLQIQDKGNSQNDVLGMVNSVLSDDYGLDIRECGIRPSTYVYLDDCMYTGNRVKWDIKNWIGKAQAGTHLHIIFYALHRSSLSYVQSEIDPICKSRGVKPSYWCEREINGNETFWPRQVLDDPLVDEYIHAIVVKAKVKGWRPRLFRPRGQLLPETVFSSPAARDIVEAAFLSKGAFIMSLPNVAKAEMRPMGFEKLESLGFGSMFVTCRNISNNSPLVLWWGIPNRGPGHPLGRWCPLFLRRGNDQDRF
jgi:hypothetical protein